MIRSQSLRFAALALLLLGGTSVQAGSIPPSSISWNYNFSPGAPAVLADTNPAAGVTFTNEPTKTAFGTSDIVATNLKVFSAASAASPDVLSANGAYSLTLQLSTVDNGTPYNATMTFTGKLTGNFSASNSNITNVFGPNSTQSVSLGSYNFVVSMNAYTPPGPPDQQNSGSISARVTVSGNQVPEPSTMLLSGLGLSLLGGTAWRKRKQKIGLVSC